jgi:hypothetical protein
MEKKQRREKMREELDKKRKEKEEKEKEEFENKKNAILERIENRKNAIEKSKTEMKKDTKKMVRKSPLHAKIIEDFKTNFVQSELDRKKQKLSEIRNFHQPIRLTNIKEHSEHKKTLLQEKLKEYFSKRESYAKAAKDHSDKYNSHFWKVVKTRETKEYEDRLNAERELKDRHQKSLDYARNVMQLYKPTVSKKKRLEMELIRKNMDDPHAMHRMRKGTKSVKNNHNQSMNSPMSMDAQSQIVKRRKKSPIKPLDEKRYSYHPSSYDKKPFIKHDYLTKKRLEKEDKEAKTTLHSIGQWQAEIERGDMNEEEKIEYIKVKSALLEEELKRKEALMKVNNAATIDDTKAIDGMLIDSIKTKLDLIGGIH